MKRLESLSGTVITRLQQGMGAAAAVLLMVLGVSCTGRGAEAERQAHRGATTRATPSAIEQQPPRPPSSNPSLTGVWRTLRDPRYRFRLDYPPSWKATNEVTRVARYTLVLDALNTEGKADFVAGDMQIGPGMFEYSPRTVAAQVPQGTAYIQVAWRDAPGGLPQFGPDVVEMEAADLAGPLRDSTETRDGDLAMRSLRFCKWGRHWEVAAYLHEPVTPSLRADVERVLNSFRFEGVPAG